MCHNFLKIQVSVFVLIDKLRHLISKKNKTVVLPLIFQPRIQFASEVLDTHIGVTIEYPETYALKIQRRSEIFCNVKYPLEFVIHKVGCIGIPVSTFFCNPLLEGFKYTFLLKGLFKMLGKCDVEFVESSQFIELIPEHMQKHDLIVGRIVFRRFKIKDPCVYFSPFQPGIDSLQVFF